MRRRRDLGDLGGGSAGRSDGGAGSGGSLLDDATLADIDAASDSTSPPPLDSYAAAAFSGAPASFGAAAASAAAISAAGPPAVLATSSWELAEGLSEGFLRGDPNLILEAMLVPCAEGGPGSSPPPLVIDLHDLADFVMAGADEALVS